MIAFLQATTGETTGTTYQTVALDPAQLQQLQDGINTNATSIGWLLAWSLLCLGGLVFIVAVRG